MGRADDLLSSIGTKIGAAVAPRENVTTESFDDDPRREGVRRAMGLHTIRIDRIVPDEDQARKTFSDESLRELGESIQLNGQAQPIAVRWDNDQQIYVLIAGERRYRAAQLCGIESLRAEIKEGLTEEQVIELQTVENLSREDLNPIEQAHAFRKYIEAKQITAKDAGIQLGFSNSTVTRSLKLLSLPEDLQQQVIEGTLPVRIARDLPKLGDAEAMREAVAKIQEESLVSEEAAEVLAIANGKTNAGKTKKSHKLKQYTSNSGIQIVATGKRRHSQAEVMDALKELLATMRKDGRIKPAA